MMGRSHLAIGFASSALYASFAPEKLMLPLAVVGTIASILPDIDEPNSMIGRFRWPIIAISTAALALTAGYIVAAMTALVGLVLVLSRHRTLTHAIWIPLAILLISLLGTAFLGQAFPAWIGGAFAMGYLSHLLGDALTYGEYQDVSGNIRQGKGGVPLFWPHPRRYRLPGTVKCGSAAEYLLVGCIIAGLVLMAQLKGW